MANAEEAWMDEAAAEREIAEEMEALHDVEGDRAGSRYNSVSGRRRLAFSGDVGADGDSPAPPSSAQQPVVPARRYVSATGGIPLSMASSQRAPPAGSESQDGGQSYEVPFPSGSGPTNRNEPSASAANTADSYEVPFPAGAGGEERPMSGQRDGSAVDDTSRPLQDSVPAAQKRKASQLPQPRSTAPADEEEDIDALLDLEEDFERDQASSGATAEPPPKRPYPSKTSAPADDFDDLLDLEDELGREPLSSSKPVSSTQRSVRENDDLLDLEAELRAQQQPGTDQGALQSSQVRSSGVSRPRMVAEDRQREDLDGLLGLQSLGSQRGGLDFSMPPRRNIASAGEASSMGGLPSDEDRRDDDDFASLPRADGQSDILARSAARDRARRYIDMQRLQGRVFKRPPLSDSVTVISTDGSDYVYVTARTAAEERERQAKSKQSWSELAHSQLLSIPFHELMQTVDEQRTQRSVQELDATLEAMRSTVDKSMADDIDLGLDDDFGDVSGIGERGDDGVTSPPPPQLVPQSPDAGSRLWVDKYSPRQYTDLLSDEGTNRTLLAWLKLWNGVVFGHKVAPPAPSKDPKKSLTPGLEGYDDHDRPKQKIALLSGPPGLGKTTLAHVIAQHAGYRVMEINASDDRSPEILRQRIEMATQNHSVIGSDRRPTCLVIDEIDGAQAAAINVLLAACGPIKHKKAAASGGAAALGLGRKKRRGAVQGLSRPIICICNDQYVPALRQLRQQALTLVFYPTQANKLAARLLSISRAERLQADMTTLLALCEKAERDIRSCLNTLQFLHRQKKPITLYMIRAASVGQKDAHKSLFELWQAVFQLPKSKRTRVQANADGTRASTDGRTSTNVSSLSNRFRTILLAAESSGEHDRVRQGLFENYLEMKYKDPSMDLITTGLGWLSDIDLLDTRLRKTQDYSFMKFFAFLPVVFHLLFATPSYPRLKYPHSMGEATQKLTRCQQVFSSLLGEAVPRVRQHFDLRQAVLDVLPPLMEIVSPFLRPVNTQLYSSKERQQLLCLIDSMISYNITYRQERLQDGQYQFVMDPNVEELVRYPGLAQKKQVTYGGKQLIAREIELEKMRRLEAVILGKANGASAASDSSAAATTTATAQGDGNSGSGTSKPAADISKPSSAMTAKEASKKEAEAKKKLMNKNKPTKIALDFFGRPIPPKLIMAADGTTRAKVADLGAPVWFKFHEGFSNAVRKPVKIQDLL